MTKLSNIVYESGNYWVTKSKTGFVIYKIGVTHSTKVATIGFSGELGEEKFKDEILRRKLLDESVL